MSRYRVTVGRKTESFITIDVEASGADEAFRKAEEEAPNREFPPAKESTYTAEGCTLIPHDPRD